MENMQTDVRVLRVKSQSFLKEGPYWRICLIFSSYRLAVDGPFGTSSTVRGSNFLWCWFNSRGRFWLFLRMRCTSEEWCRIQARGGTPCTLSVDPPLQKEWLPSEHHWTIFFHLFTFFFFFFFMTVIIYLRYNCMIVSLFIIFIL